jgi:hypothetical protein
VDVATLACLIAATFLLLRLHLMRAGVSPVRDPVSDYGNLFYRAFVVLLGAAGVLLAIQLHQETDARGVVWLWVFGALSAAAAFMPLNTSGAPMTVAALVIDWTGQPKVLGPLAIAIAAAAVAIFVGRTTKLPVLGVADRIYYAATIAWLAIAAINVLG